MHLKLLAFSHIATTSLIDYTYPLMPKNVKTDIDPSTTETTTVVEKLSNRRQSHSAIERRRRERMNESIAILREMVPDHIAKKAIDRTPKHKLDVLESVIEYVKSLENEVFSLKALLPHTTTTNPDVKSEPNTIVSVAPLFTAPTASSVSPHKQFTQISPRPSHLLSPAPLQHLPYSIPTNRPVFTKARSKSLSTIKEGHGFYPSPTPSHYHSPAYQSISPPRPMHQSVSPPHPIRSAPSSPLQNNNTDRSPVSSGNKNADALLLLSEQAVCHPHICAMRDQTLTSSMSSIQNASQLSVDDLLC